jgi:thiamine biosynthesis protein ThiS
MLVEVALNASLADVLRQWNKLEGNKAGGGKTEVRYVIAVNKEFVPRSDYAVVVVQDGDEIDLVRPVWGG